MSLDPKITKDSSGMYWLNWTPDTTAEGYSFVTPNGQSRTFDSKMARTKLGKNLTEPVSATVSALDVTTRAAESASYPPVVTPPPIEPPPVVTPPPTGDLEVLPPVGPFTLLDGNYASAAAPNAFVRTASATAIKKMQVKEFTGYGIGSMQYYPPTVENPGRTLVEDCIAEDILSNPPASMDGKGEAGFWFGNPTDAKRLVSRNCGWMGIWTGSKCHNSVIEDFQVDQSVRGVGLYVEHVTKDSVFRRFKIKSAGTGINIEWWYGGQGSSNLVFEDGDIYCPATSGYTLAGIFADAGTFGCTFRRIRFWGPGNAIGLPNKLVDPSKPNKVENCVFENTGKHVYYHDNGIGG